MSNPWREALYPLLVLALTGLAYGHLVGNYFWLDDYYYLYLMNDRRPLEFVLTVHGGHVQSLRNLALWSMRAAFGVRAELFFAVVLLTHLVNALLLYALLRRVTASEPLACFGALLWSTNRLAEGSLGWLSVVGHVMVGTLLLAALLGVQRAADADDEVPPPPAGEDGDENAPRRRSGARLGPVTWYVALLLGSLCFGTGVGVALVFPAVLALWLPGPRWRRVRRAFWTLPAATLALYLLFHWLYFLVTEQADNTVTSAPVLLDFVGFAALMLASLLAVSVTALLAGPYLFLLVGSTAKIAAFGLLGAGVAATSWRGEPVLRRRLWAAVLLSAGAYATIAAGRAPVVVSSLFPVVEAAAWPRYHYVGSIGMAVAVTLLAAQLGRWRPLPGRLAAALLVAWLLWVTTGLLRYPIGTPYWLDPRQAMQRLNYRIARHVRESPDGQRAYIVNHHFKAVGPYVAHSVFPGQAAAFVAFHDQDRIRGIDVYFVEPDLDTVAAVRARPRSRTAGLLVTPEEYERLTAR